MRNMFSGYYALSEQELADLWQTCTFIVDTNVLLNLYRYQKQTSDELISVLKKISSRLWIPFQVGLEYQENRLNVINEQMAMYHKVQAALDTSIEQLRQALYALELKKRHSLIDPTSFLESIEAVNEQFRLHLEELKKAQPSVHDYDHLREQIDDIFAGRVGSPPTTQAELDDIYRVGEARYAKNLPPGYADIDKDKELTKRKERTAFTYGGMTFERKYGDLILWTQIIEEAASNDRLKKIIFVTGEIKDDWWIRVERSGTREKAIMGPRPELVQEIAEKAGVTAFHMYQIDEFVLGANQFLGTPVSQEMVEQIRDVSSLQRDHTDSKTIRFEFRVNKSFVNYSHHPITIPRAFNEIAEANKFEDENVLVVCPYGTVTGAIYSSGAGWGQYYQIVTRGVDPSDDPFRNFAIGQSIVVEVERATDIIRVSLTPT